MVAVVIPIYRLPLTNFEEISLRQAYTVLAKHPIVVVKPNKLDISKVVIDFPKLQIESFDDEYFAGIAGYNKLMLSGRFYKRFLNYQYILIYQLDAYVFRDELTEWCNKGFDYIGAPWLKKPVYKLPLVKQLMWLTRTISQWRNRPNSQFFYDKIGNGGFSLRATQAHYDVTLQLSERIKEYLSNPDTHFFNEDIFWATEDTKFNYPKAEEALSFSFDKYPAYCYKLTGQKLPFGCHAWYSRKMKNFWRPIIGF